MNKYFPQNEAERFAKVFPECKRLVTISKYMCCASVALWIMGVDEKEHTSIIADELGKGLENDCNVKWLEFFKNVSGRNIAVQFKDIKSLNDLKGIKGKIAVKFKCGDNYHWVGVENCTVKYNSIEISNCVKNGKPVTARIITFK